MNEFLNNLCKTHVGVEQQVIQLEISVKVYDIAICTEMILFWTKCTV